MDDFSNDYDFKWKIDTAFMKLRKEYGKSDAIQNKIDEILNDYLSKYQEIRHKDKNEIYNKAEKELLKKLTTLNE